MHACVTDELLRVTLISVEKPVEQTHLLSAHLSWHLVKNNCLIFFLKIITLMLSFLVISHEKPSAVGQLNIYLIS